MATDEPQSPNLISAATPYVVPPSQNKKKKTAILIVAGVIVLAVVVAGAIWFWQTHQKTQPAQETVSSAGYADYQQALQFAQGAQQISDPAAKASQFLGAASLMNRAGKHQNSLDYYLEAQSIIDANNLQKTEKIDYSAQIAEQYKILGKKDKAKEYYDKAIAFVKLSPENPDMNKVIQQLQSTEDKL